MQKPQQPGPRPGRWGIGAGDPVRRGSLAPLQPLDPEAMDRVRSTGGDSSHSLRKLHGSARMDTALGSEVQSADSITRALRKIDPTTISHLDSWSRASKAMDDSNPLTPQKVSEAPPTALPPMDGAEALLDNLGKGQARMEQELGAIRLDLAHLKELMWRTGGAAAPDLTWPEAARKTSELRLSTWLTKATLASEPWPDKTTKKRRPDPEGRAEIEGQVERGVPAGCAGDEEPPSHEAELPPGFCRESRSLPPGLESSSSFGDTQVHVPPSLPSSWPASIEGRAVAMAETPDATPHHLPGAELRSQKTTMLETFVTEEKPRFVLDPNSNLCLTIAAFTLLVLCHDMFMIPFVLAWELPLEGTVLALAWFSCFYWTVDMFLGFFTGYHKGQEVELRIGRLVHHYAVTWFVPDLVVVLTDWFSLLVARNDTSGPGSVSRLLRFAKLGKLVRLLGLLRMTKIVQIFEEFIENSLNDQTRMGLRLLQFLLAVVWLCHLICCGWFAVGKTTSDTGMRWTDSSTQQGALVLEFMEASILYQYVTALHWSLAQFSLGAIEITCYNSWERIFNMMCIFIGLICGSVIVGTFSATMVDYQMVRKEHAQKLSKLRRYLRENRRFVSKHTAVQVQQQAVERLKVKQRLQERDVQVLQLVSSALRSELRFEIFAPLLNTHGLFQVWATLDRTTTRRVCVEALEYQHCRPHDEIFLAGTITNRAHHIAAGNVVYIKDPETAPVLDQEVYTVAVGTWLAEAGLWTQWIHVGTAKTVGHCDVLTVTSNAVEMMVEHHPQVGSITKHYAKQFFRCIVTSNPPQNTYPDDLEVPHTQFDEIVMSCQPSVQRAVSLHLIQHANTKPGAFRELKDEIRQGKSCVVLTKEGKIQRMVSVVVLDLSNSDGHVLVEVAKAETGEHGSERRFKPSCQLPAKKQSQGEVSMDTLCRILGKLRFTNEGLVDDLEMKGLERQVQRGWSDQFGVETKYLRKVYTATTRDHDMFGIPFHDPEDSSSCVGVDIHTGDVDLGGHEPVYANGSANGVHTVRSTNSILFRLPNKDEVCLDNVPVIIDQDKRSLLAWLDPAAFEHLRSPAGKSHLKSWVDMLNEVNLEALGINTPPEPDLTGMRSMSSQSPLRHEFNKKSGFGDRLDRLSAMGHQGWP